jgi:hypothetical protein
MSTFRRRRSSAPQVPDYPHHEPTEELILPATREQWQGRADCCVAAPTVRVVLPASPESGKPAELLLCAHHFHAHRDALLSSGASFYDESGIRIAVPA